MTEEDAFLRKLLEQPNNDLTRLVYADWLDEQGTPEATAKAEFLRLIADAELAGKFDTRVQALTRKLPRRWLAVVTKLPIQNCRESKEPEVRVNTLGMDFVFECPKRWEELTPTEDGNDVRFCDACHKTVHYCRSQDELRRNVDAMRCVAVELSVVRRPGDLEPELFRHRIAMGIAEYDPPESEEEPPRRSWWSRLWRRG